MADIRALVFNSGTFDSRADLGKMSEKELWQLWEKDEDQVQVQMYYLDEFSCAFNDGEISNQDWLYFVDYDNIKQDAEVEKVLRKQIRNEVMQNFCALMCASDIENMNMAIEDAVVQDVKECSDYPNYNGSDIRIAITRVILNRVNGE